MEKKIDLQVEKATQLLNSDSLLSLVNETPFTILAKKFFKCQEIFGEGGDR